MNTTGETGATSNIVACYVNVTKASPKERKEIFLSALPRCFEMQDFNEAHCKVVARIFSLTLQRYSDRTSRKLVCDAMGAFIHQRGEMALKGILPELLKQACTLPMDSSSKSIASVALSLLQWTKTIILKSMMNNIPITGYLMEIIKIQVAATHVILGSGAIKWLDCAYANFKSIFQQFSHLVEIYLQKILEITSAQGEGFTLLGLLTRYLAETKKVATLAPMKEAYLENLMKHTLTTKVKPSNTILAGAGPFLKHISHDDFKKSLLPTMQKALLRNPEIVIEAISQIIGSVSLDLSQYADDILKGLSAHLYSQNEDMKGGALESVKNLAKQLSDSGAVESALDSLFGILAGGQGKLSLAEQRISVLRAIQYLHSSALGGSSVLEHLGSVVVKRMTPFLAQEGHEGTLIQALKTLNTWCGHFSTCLPNEFVDLLKKGLGARTSTPVVRMWYLTVAGSVFTGNTLHKALSLVGLLNQHAEKIKSQGYQVSVVGEAIAACLLLAKISTLDDAQQGNKMQEFFNLLLERSDALTADKFLTTGSTEALELLLKLIESLLRNHMSMFSVDKRRVWYRPLALLLVHPSWQTRKATMELLQRLYSLPSLNPREIHDSLLQAFQWLLGEQSVLAVAELKEGDSPVGSQEFSLRAVAPNVLRKALQTICEGGTLSETARKDLMFSVLVDTHHEKIVSCDPNAFVKICKAVRVTPADIVEEYKEKILLMVEEATSLSTAQERALSTLLKVDNSALMSTFHSNFVDFIQTADLAQVTVVEYHIMKTPDGELYDKSVLEGMKTGEPDLKNIKKESKAYSYKEQKMELELREELMKKKGQISKRDEKPKLSKKQQEILEARLEEEKSIRERLLKLDKLLEKHCTILMSCIDWQPHAMRTLLPSLVQSSLGLMRSPLAAPHMARLFVHFKNIAFEEEYIHLGNLVAYATLRVLAPACDIHSGWCEEGLQEIVTRAVSALHTFTTEQNIYILMTYTFKRAFPSFTFSYFLPLLEAVLLNKSGNLGDNEDNRNKALQLCLLHAKKRTAYDNDGQQVLEDDPDLLPRASLLRILSTVIFDAEGNAKELKIQRAAQSAFLEVCKAGSGDVGCGFVTNEEIVILLDNLLSKSSALRRSSVEGLLNVLDVLPDKESTLWNLLCRRILICKFDVDEDIADVSGSIWEKGGLSTNPAICRDLLVDVIHVLENVRTASCSALKIAVSENDDVISEIIASLMALYDQKIEIPPPVVDSLGRLISPPFNDPWETRDGIAEAFNQISSLIPDIEVIRVFSFFLPTALGDRNEIVRRRMLVAATSLVNDHGKEHMSELLSVLEAFLDEAQDSSAHDIIRQSAVILLGSLAKHLEKTDPKVKPIFGKLMDTLMTPSQQVQEAVANCLPPLCPAIKEEAGDHVQMLLERLLESEKYGNRRGAAYGLAGLVKGLGILALRQHNIITKLTEAIQDKKNARHREGALFAFETLCGMLGRLFEPYVVHLLPHLLLCFGDGNQYVREAADETAKAVMRNLSAHGVKLILPSLLKALEEDSWRTKTGSVELLGAMAFCAPKQLSSCLPSIVPRLTEVLADSHLKVQKAGQQALKQIGGVVRNPEIQEISSIILGALADPASKTVPCLQALLNTAFVHFIDSPSLALIMPCLERALDQRSTETKKMAAQILGNMYALTDYKDLVPYLPAIVPGLKKSLLDPSPEVRAVSARALGAMVKSMGEEGFNELLPWLLETLTSENSSVDRSGAAQGLSEVLHGLGMEKLDKLMPDVVATTSKAELAPHVREGYLMLYIYLPTTFGDEFVKYIGPIIPSILKGLADEAEFVRDTSFKAGQRIITMYADTAISLLLPELESGLFDDNWRIRYSSVQLLGDLLFKITGVTGKMSTEGDEDDNFGTSHSTKAIMGLLGHDRRNRVLAGLYMGRSDVALLVRQASLHVWKVVVQNTARTLREILPTLFSLLLGCLASTSIDKRQIAARTLGDLVRKLGERILPEIIPILENGLENGKNDERQGVCIGLSEIMASTSRDMVMQFEDSLIVTIRKALLDDLPEVRAAAAEAFRKLFETIDRKALEGVFPFILAKLEDPKYSEKALDAIKQVISSRGKDMLSFLVPRLITPPVNTRALAILSSVAGDGLTRHISKILPAMLRAMDTSYGNELQEETTQASKTLVIAIEDEVGIRTIVDELIIASKSEVTGIRWATALLLATFCKDCAVDYSSYVQQLLRGIVLLMNDTKQVVYEEAWEALGALIKRLEPAEQVQHIGSLRQAIRFVKDDLRDGLLPGFCILKKGITPVLPMFKEGILNGTQDVKEQAAFGLGEIVQITSVDALKPSVVSITGPLIRILGDRFVWNVKVAILETLSLLLHKVGVALKPFLPQLQTTFVKALNDPTAAVRQKAAHALKLLTVLHTRVDQLFTELRNGIKNNEESAIRETMLEALRGITLTAGKKMNEPVRKNILDCVTGLLGSPEDGIRVASGGALGSLFTVMSDAEIATLCEEQLFDSDPSVDWTLRHGRTVALSYALFDAPDRVMATMGDGRVVDVVVAQGLSDRVPICIYGVHSLGHLMLFNNNNNMKSPNSVMQAIQKALLHSSNDVRKAVLQTVRFVARSAPADTNVSFVLPLLSAVTVNYRDPNTAVKALSESALFFCLGLHLGEDDKYRNILSAVSGDTASVIQEIHKAASGRLTHLKYEKEDYPFLSCILTGEG